MKIKKKRSKKEILRGKDEFVSAIDRFINFILKNKKIAIYVVLIILFLNCIVYAYFSYRKNKFVEASILESKAIKALNENKKDEAKDFLKKILSSYKNTPAYEKALFLIANLYFDAGEYKKACKYYKLFLKKHKKNDFCKLLAKLNLAKSYEADKKYDEAAKLYEKLKEEKNFNFIMYEAKFHLAKLYKKNRRLSEAKKIYEEIVDKAPNSIWGKFSKLELEKIK